MQWCTLLVFLPFIWMFLIEPLAKSTQFSKNEFFIVFPVIFKHAYQFIVIALPSQCSNSKLCGFHYQPFLMWNFVFSNAWIREQVWFIENRVCIFIYWLTVASMHEPLSLWCVIRYVVLVKYSIQTICFPWWNMCAALLLISKVMDACCADLQTSALAKEMHTALSIRTWIRQLNVKIMPFSAITILFFLFVFSPYGVLK